VFWDNARREAQSARQHGDRITAERACARGILYVQTQVVKVMYAYADALDRQSAGAGTLERGKAQKLELARDAQSRGQKSGNSYLGFDPAAELKAYADLLSSLRRNNDALLVEALSAAYSYSQEANLRRTTLQSQGKDPLGEC
jgi:hypothetical protein